MSTACQPGKRVACGSLLILAFVAGLSGAASSGDTHRVLMKSVDYEPKTITARVGDTVEWVNEDIVAHTATANDRSWEVNVLPVETLRSEAEFERQKQSRARELVVLDT